MTTAALLATVATPAAAQLCDMRVYDSSFGERLKEADTVFPSNAQFVVCFRAREDGFVSLWDRMPTEAPVERLVPNVNFTGAGEYAARVSGGDETCFGTGQDGYYLIMDENDGDGVGLMWIVYTPVEEIHPTAETFGSSDQFADAWASNALGAAPIPVSPGDAPDAGRIGSGDVSECTWERSLEYQYRVVRP